MTRTALGIVTGLALGLALAVGSFGQMLIVALFAVIGFAAKVLAAGLAVPSSRAGHTELGMA